MAEPLRPLPPLQDAQAAASDPGAHVWLAASAGTGKTQVLAARVFRLLLGGTDPAAILCLTFTKAGAAEMAERVSRRLAAWVRMPAPQLSADLDALGERPTPALQDRARTLFARVLDAPGGGLRIQTIHGFCQSLLAAFPAEAGLVPGFRPAEPREEAALAREALAELLVTAEREGRAAPRTTIGALSVRLGEAGAENFLRECARRLPGLEELPAGIRPFLRRAFDLPPGDVDTAVAEGCAALDRAAIARLAAANRGWGAATGLRRAAALEGFTADAAGAAALAGALLTGKGEPYKSSAKLLALEPDYDALAAAIGGECARLLALRVRADYADLLADALDVGRDYARGYALAKRRAGTVDFDNLIDATVALLAQPGIGEWVRYKLDQTTEHVLIDEAQDTNARQWAIVRALVDEFFVGRGVHAPGTRTLFTVGDYKQAIFGFQGTDPANFADAARHFAEKAITAAGDDTMPLDERGLPFALLALTHSFRSTEPVLAFVDAAIAAAGPGALGIDAVEPHASRVPGPGTVTLLPPVVAGGDGDDAGEEGYIDDATRMLATQLARRVKRWLGLDGTPALRLESKGRALEPGDVMILVKRRGDLARLIVARLYAEGVPVAGVDRLRLNAPLAVQDLLAAIRFVLQPDDDLSLAALLVSPLLGWTQEELRDAALGRPGRLWPHLLATQFEDRLAPLRAMLSRADLVTPYQFLEELLSGPLGGRRRLLERLGEEARDPIDELLAAALDFETTATPSLQRFLDWFDRGEVEIVRDAAQPQDAVRVMTAHAAKGLQAPLVILADATADPDSARRETLAWRPAGQLHPIALFRPRSAETGGPLAELVAAAAAKERAEHWRLFYVAATRAEERLVIAGALSARWNGVPPEASWYAAAARAFAALGAAGEGERHYIGNAGHAAMRARPSRAASPAPEPLPDWVRRPAPVEARPPRPLAPSSLGADDVADPPPAADMRAAARRGELIHALFERLPALDPAARRDAADRWLATVGRVTDAAERVALAAPVLAILDDPRFAALFAGDALAEAPVAAVLDDGTVVAGTVDRLLIGPDRICVVDYKTGRRAPAGIAEVPSYHLRQMAAYAAALAVIFPDRPVAAALLYTAGPTLIELPPALLAAHKPGYAVPEQS